MAGACSLAVVPAASANVVKPRSAAAFRDSAGVVTHVVYFDTAYGNWPRVVARLDELGVLPFNRGATDGQFVHQLRRKGRQAEAKALVGLNRLFAVAWYGGRPTGPTEYEAAQAQWRELEALTAS